MKSAYTSAYVFSRLACGECALVGQLSSKGAVGSFRYWDSWLEHPHGYPLDPVNLPLVPGSARSQSPKAVFGVFTDAGPDDWGTRILLLHHNGAPKNEIERLLRTSGRGVGVLEFSLSRSAPKSAPPLPDIAMLSELAQVVQQVQDNGNLSPEQLALIEPGSSMGGARPKTSVSEGVYSWLVKFSRPGDIMDFSRLEYATMQLMGDAGLDVPEVRLKPLGQGRAAFMIKRFDRGPGHPVHFISAHSLFNIDRLRSVRDSRYNPYSYVNLARILRQHAGQPQRDCRELFRRMAFNILVGNTDDHARNHAMIYDTASRSWGLSPVYDVLPTVNGNRGRQAMGVGRAGADSTRANALSCAPLFMLNSDQAREDWDAMEWLAQRLPEAARDAGMAPADIDIVRAHLDQSEI